MVATIFNAQVESKPVTLVAEQTPVAGARVELRLEMPDGRATSVLGTVLGAAGPGRARVELDPAVFQDYGEVFVLAAREPSQGDAPSPAASSSGRTMARGTLPPPPEPGDAETEFVLTPSEADIPAVGTAPAPVVAPPSPAPVEDTTYSVVTKRKQR
jgi:hypothetical protein